MIKYDEPSKTFTLELAHSIYVFRVDEVGRIVHTVWSPRPEGNTAGEIDGSVVHEYANYEWEQEGRPDELVTFGDNTCTEVSLKVSFPALPPGVAADSIPNLPVRDVRLRYRGHEIVTDATPGFAAEHGQTSEKAHARETLKVHLSDTLYPFAVTLCYRLTPEHDIIERWLELENRCANSPIDIEVCNSATLQLPNGCNELTHVDGNWTREFTPRNATLPIGVRQLEHRGLQTGHNHNPFFMLNHPGRAHQDRGTVFFGQLAFSGNWRIAIEQLPSSVMRVHGGYNPFDFGLSLAPGEHHKTPALICGVTAKGWGGASLAMHRHLRDYILPHPERALVERPVLYNSWEATYFEVSHDNQLDLARRAADLGVELFCVDDGWFGARRNEHAGLGDWEVSPAAFPNGLEPLVEQIHELGMKFGLWVEPEMVNPDSDLYRAHPDWVLHFPGRDRNVRRNQLILDFGRDEVVEWITEKLSALVARYDIDFIKWDMNRYPTEPGSVSGRGIWRKHVTGLYHIMDTLRARHPKLLIQSCSGGGGRIDAGILARADQAWTSDNTDALDRIRIQEGHCLAYPPCCMESWVTHEKNHQTGRKSELSTRFEVAMRGVLGIGSNLRELGEEEKEIYRAYIAFYKKIRPTVQLGDLYVRERLAESGRSVLQYVSDNGRRSVLSVAVRDHLLGQVRPALTLTKLNSGARYRITDRHGAALHTLSGFDLMTRGIPGDATGGSGYTRTLLLEQI